MRLLFPGCRETHVTETYTKSSGWRNWTLNISVAQDRHKKPLPHENYLWLRYLTTYLFSFVLFFPRDEKRQDNYRLSFYDETFPFL